MIELIYVHLSYAVAGRVRVVPLKPGCAEQHGTKRVARTQVGSYTNFFADALIAEAELDARVVGIHAAMGGGTGMNRFEKRFHERTFDVGIAEQASQPHAFHEEESAVPTTMKTRT